MLNAAGDVTGTYDKVFLMLFGEYIPFYDAIPWFTKLFPRRRTSTAAPTRDLSAAGGRPRLPAGPADLLRGHPPGFARRVAKLGPNAFINITNDAWFGRTAEPYQHLALAVFRSVEHRIEMVRAVNTGVSAHIDAAGPRSRPD
jgi:apolipoprotein N-acyltransferase